MDPSFAAMLAGLPTWHLRRFRVSGTVVRAQGLGQAVFKSLGFRGLGFGGSGFRV